MHVESLMLSSERGSLSTRTKAEVGWHRRTAAVWLREEARDQQECLTRVR